MTNLISSFSDMSVQLSLDRSRHRNVQYTKYKSMHVLVYLILSHHITPGCINITNPTNANLKHGVDLTSTLLFSYSYQIQHTKSDPNPLHLNTNTYSIKTPISIPLNHSIQKFHLITNLYLNVSETS